MALRWSQEFLWKNNVIPKVIFLSFNLKECNKFKSQWKEGRGKSTERRKPDNVFKEYNIKIPGNII